MSSKSQVLGQRIRKAREHRKVTQQQLGKEIGCSQGKINKIESGQVPVKPGDLASIIEALDVELCEAREMRELLRQLEASGAPPGRRTPTPKWFKRFRESEEEATRVRGWHVVGIPGSLQGEPYMLALFPTDTGDPGGIAAHISDRLTRQEVFTRNRGGRFAFVLDEGLFHHIAGGLRRVVALDQVERLLQLLDEHPNLELRVLTFAAEITYKPAEFSIVTMPGEAPDFVYVERADGADYLDKPATVALYEQEWRRLLGAALDPGATRGFLLRWRRALRREGTPPEEIS